MSYTTETIATVSDIVNKEIDRFLGVEGKQQEKKKAKKELTWGEAIEGNIQKNNLMEAAIDAFMKTPERSMTVPDQIMGIKMPAHVVAAKKASTKKRKVKECLDDLQTNLTTDEPKSDKVLNTRFYTAKLKLRDHLVTGAKESVFMWKGMKHRRDEMLKLVEDIEIDIKEMGRYFKETYGINIEDVGPEDLQYRNVI